MSVMVIGGDYLGVIEKNLYSLGVTKLVHIDGRKAIKKSRLNIPKQISCVLVFSFFVNHNIVKIVKDAAKTQGVPSFFTKRSWGAMEAASMQDELLKLQRAN